MLVASDDYPIGISRSDAVALLDRIDQQGQRYRRFT
jgi:hypothetical protein